MVKSEANRGRGWATRIGRTNKQNYDGCTVAHTAGGRCVEQMHLKISGSVTEKQVGGGNIKKKSEMILGSSPSKKQDTVTPGGNVSSPQTIIHIPEVPSK